MRKMLVVAVMAAVTLTGCSKGETDAGGGSPCGPAPSPVADLSQVPSGFPSPSGFVVTGIKPIGPSLELTGYWKGDLGSGYDAFKQAFSTGGYSVTASEKDVADAEVSYTGNLTSGQVRLKVDCKDRTSTTITIRPSV